MQNSVKVKTAPETTKTTNELIQMKRIDKFTGQKYRLQSRIEQNFSLAKHYRKNSKIWDTSINCHNRPKNRKIWCNIALMHPKDADGMANSVDPDQTASSEAVWSWSALFAETYLSQYIEFVR